MKHRLIKVGLFCLSSIIVLAACSKSESEKPASNAETMDVEQSQALAASPSEPSGFSIEQAKENLMFTKNQYLKMLEHIEQKRKLHLAPSCKNDATLVCYPRAREDKDIMLDRPSAWTNGFYPGLLWKLLANNKQLDLLTEQEEQSLLAATMSYQLALAPEAMRGNTHDLGFILYDSFGEALEYDGISLAQRASFRTLLDQGRATLAKRYSPEHEVIKSWDFINAFRLLHTVDGQVQDSRFSLSAPWSFPVIVDNMMNLEFLLKSDNAEYHEIAYNHATQTMKHHYFFEQADVNKQRPLAYHLIDYDTMRHGNWQGMGAVSAWARGQAWSYYGFVTVLEQMQKDKVQNLADFEGHLEGLFNALAYFLNEEPVPMWDFFAARDKGNEIASNADPSTTYSRILDLCPSRLGENILPYKGYRPITVDKTMLTDEAIEEISNLRPVYGERFIVDGKIAPCGTEDYDLTNRTLTPKDTSAAAIMAAGMYRYAQFTTNADKKQRLINLADKIMLSLSANYRSDKDTSDNNVSYDLGFVLTQATGNIPEGSEINTSIVYGDFYFTEANIRKLQLAQ